ncbi:hypothetical protein [Providencia manganoxydans]|uniref:hypothetical protein n=1 Tax=Providencia manganoxydans TaxID=2923283 RepID=UPI0032DA2621
MSPVIYDVARLSELSGQFLPSFGLNKFPDVDKKSCRYAVVIMVSRDEGDGSPPT